MIENFKKFIEAQILLSPNSKTLLAVSGGIDSVVMVDLFNKSGLSYSIAHCNFQLRGKESNEDQDFVEQMAKDLNVEFFTQNFDTLNYSEINKVSIQVAARDLRYQWFSTFLENHGQIAVAHHQNDALETMIFNLTKGTGLAGLRGIKPKNGKIIRPLLFASRHEIEKYAFDNQLEWREDSSNISTKYARNLIRHEVIPILKKINPSLEKTSVSTFERLTLVENFIQDSIKSLEGSMYFSSNEGLKIEINPLKRHASALLILSELIFPYGFTFYDAQQIFKIIDQSESKRFLSAEYELIKERETIQIFKRHNYISSDIWYEIGEGDQQFSMPEFKISIKEFDFKADFKFSEIKGSCMDKDKLNFPLVLRKWKSGDSFQPLGMKGKKKISDFLIDQKVEMIDKSKVWVLCSGEEIIWVVGHRMSEKAKIDSNTKKVICFSKVEV